jgi:hypothetical protein
MSLSDSSLPAEAQKRDIQGVVWRTSLPKSSRTSPLELSFLPLYIPTTVTLQHVFKIRISYLFITLVPKFLICGNSHIMPEDDQGNLEPPRRTSIADPGAHDLRRAFHCCLESIAMILY